MALHYSIGAGRIACGANDHNTTATTDAAQTTCGNCRATSAFKAGFFWGFVSKVSGQSEQERLQAIDAGYDSGIVPLLASAFSMSAEATFAMLGCSGSEINRKVKFESPLDASTSERIDRLLELASEADQVFESKDAALAWLTQDQLSLGGVKPVALCRTELGARQVRRAIKAIEYGAPL
jgi:putative toxin-antitoxin system antitoxin component (TIGR02293 family)|tara:strand:- start:1926 stop:2465 length:540 start_codon:yes stop_codon:yes gene_type:complete